LLAQAGEFAFVVFKGWVGPGGVGVAEAVFGEKPAHCFERAEVLLETLRF
jgi:hypothetical protein